jgi:predicted nucleotidyltransferase
MRSLTDSFLQSLVTRLDDDNTVGVTLAGSFARGEGGPYSDVDIHQYVRQMPADDAAAYILRYMDGHLVSITLMTVDVQNANLRDPKKAIWAVPGLRQERILLDKDGSIAAVKDSAVKFNWEPMQAAADAYASWNLGGFAEEIHKILAGLAQRDESMTLNASMGLTQGMAITLLVQRGAFISSENVFITVAQDTAGRESDWTRQYRLAIGLDPLSPERPVFIGRGVAGLHLYCETARLLQDILQPEDAVLVNRATEIIREAGY